MSIFKGNSIYKTGAGGGGYKDGGALVDGDFIEVKNNTVSSYDNVSRDPVNFYFEVKDGEILNSVVELTTAVNATINVYVVKDGLYYLLGNVGGNTVNAGDDYKINITGDSYSIEQVSSGPVPEYAEILGSLCKISKIGSRLWTSSNFTGVISGVDYKNENGTYYYSNISTDLKNFNYNGWRVARYGDFEDLKSRFTPNQLKQTGTPYSSWNSRAQGTGDILFYPYGMFSPFFQLLGSMAAILYIQDSETRWWKGFGLNSSTDTYDGFNPYDGGGYYNIRLVKQI